MYHTATERPPLATSVSLLSRLPSPDRLQCPVAPLLIKTSSRLFSGDATRLRWRGRVAETNACLRLPRLLHGEEEKHFSESPKRWLFIKAKKKLKRLSKVHFNPRSAVGRNGVCYRCHFRGLCCVPYGRRQNPERPPIW